ncbi:MAG: NAD-binding protein [Deltaproteobacteria bacterium]|nr:NAD-binding protein [Deltaproteobacteria bacterium]
MTSQFLAILKQREMRQNVKALLKVLAVTCVVIAVYSVAFHLLMLHEGQEHSWLTGVYWTLTVMSTLGFGDITFHTDLGRGFSVLVLLTGVLLLLIVLPFAFIRHFYAPWLEAQIRVKAPRKVDPAVKDHVIIGRHDAIADVLIAQLDAQGVDYVVLEPDPTKAVALHEEGVKVLVGERDSVDTWRAAGAGRARMAVANLGDTDNTNLTLTLREHAPDLPVAAVVDDFDAVDILELAGADHVVALSHQLGEHLAAHTSAGKVGAHVIGQVDQVMIAEFLVRGTGLAGKTIRETELRDRTGLSVVALSERGRLVPANPDQMLTEDCVIVVGGGPDQVQALNDTHVIEHPSDEAVVVIGGGKVGRAAIRALAERGVRANVIEANESLRPRLEELADRVVIGRAEELRHMQAVGIERAPSVLLTTHDDAVNIFLAVYARRLNPEGHIISRVTHLRNAESLHRAGANFILSSSSLGATMLLSVLQERELVVVGEGIDVFVRPLPPSLEGRTLADSAIGAKTGLNVIGARGQGQALAVPTADEKLCAGSEIVLLGTPAQLQAFNEAFPA